MRISPWSRLAIREEIYKVLDDIHHVIGKILYGSDLFNEYGRLRNWSYCDECGRYIPMLDYENETAYREMVTPDTDFTMETYETICRRCNSKSSYYEEECDSEN